MARGGWTELGRNKLASSGLTTKQADALGMWETPSAALLHKSFEALPALVIPYFDHAGNPLSYKSKWPNFYRVRYLKKGGDFKSMATDKAQRYAQEPQSGVCAYLPRSRPWHTIAKDPQQEIILTEGELKAAAACLHDFNVIGLGGVWNFKASYDGLLMLPELEKINWVKRPVFICYDSDYTEKSQVCRAINALCEELEERGAVVRVVLLPSEDSSKKTGLDDYLLANGKDAFDVLLNEAELLGMSRALWAMNEEVLYAEDPGLIVVYETGQKIDVSKFRDHSRWASVNTIETRVGKDGNIVREKVAAAPIWVRWPLRRFVRRVTYAPGEERITENNEYNGWQGWGVEPTKGDVKPFIELFNFIFKGVEAADREWVLDWMAYPIQHPGTKLFTSVVVHGIEQGTGKTLIGYTLGDIYGKNFKEITDQDLEDGQTWWAENKQFIVGDEITGNDNRQHQATLKRLITQEDISINIKFIPQYTVPDRINYYFTAQHGDAFFLEDRDRRYFVNEVQGEPLPEEFYRKYDQWRRDGGAAHLMQWLLDRKIKSFNPNAPAPQTAAKKRMILAGKGDLGKWINELIQNPDSVLRNGQLQHTRDLYTAGELLSMFRAHVSVGAERVTSSGMGRALGNAGIRQVFDGDTIKDPTGVPHRYYAVRNADKWLAVKHRKTLEQHIKQHPPKRMK